MPYIDPEFLQHSIFLYGSKEDAEDGVNWGGSGFLFGIPSEANPACCHLYAVSNDHVIEKCPVIRLTKRDGSTEIVERRDEDWTPHSEGDDIAVCPLGAMPERDYVFAEPFELMNERMVGGELASVSVGDDCFMVGRYINREQHQLDQPVMRFGNLAMLVEPIKQKERTFDQDSFLVDMRSLAGFSGSPVFVYYEVSGPRIPLPDWWETPKHWSPSSSLPGDRSPSGIISRYWLLGIDWGHLPIHANVKDADGESIGKMEVNSGMAGIVPSWKLAELLECPKLVTGRERADEQLVKDDENAEVLDVAEPPTKPKGKQ